MMKERIYLDNCCFNRPYDDKTVLKNYLEAEAKTYIQKEIKNNTFELAWSYMMDYEISFNPFDERREQIMKWKSLSVIDIDYSSKIDLLANEILKKNINPKDSLHISCAIEAGCRYFITTDSKILNKNVGSIILINPIEFVGVMGVKT